MNAIKRMSSTRNIGFLYDDETSCKHIGILVPALDDGFEFEDDFNGKHWSRVCERNYFFEGTESQFCVCILIYPYITSKVI